MRIETLKIWEDREDVELTAFLTMPDAFIKEPVKKPAVIVCPGGAYMSCPRHGNEGDPVAMTFAADGYQAFVLEYSVTERAPKGKTLFPAQLLDFGKAVLLIREHAQKWCVDVEKISIIGFSAGAHLCGMYATTWQQPLLAEHFGVEANVFRPLSAILMYGLMDYVFQDEYTARHPSPLLPRELNVPVFGSIRPKRELLERYSPIYHISEDTPPIFLGAAADDAMVPSIQSIKMAQRLAEKQIPYELHIFQYGSHGFALGRNLIEPFREERAHVSANWVPLAKKFLMHQISGETAEYEKDPFAFMEE